LRDAGIARELIEASERVRVAPDIDQGNAQAWPLTLQVGEKALGRLAMRTAFPDEDLDLRQQASFRFRPRYRLTRA